MSALEAAATTTSVVEATEVSPAPAAEAPNVEEAAEAPNVEEAAAVATVSHLLRSGALI